MDALLNKSLCQLPTFRAGGFLFRLPDKPEDGADKFVNWPRAADDTFYGLLTNYQDALLIANNIEISREYADHADIWFNIGVHEDVASCYASRAFDVVILKLGRDTRQALLEIGFQFLELSTEAFTVDQEVVVLNKSRIAPLQRGTGTVKMVAKEAVSIESSIKASPGSPIIGDVGSNQVIGFVKTNRKSDAKTFEATSISSIVEEIAKSGGFRKPELGPKWIPLPTISATSTVRCASSLLDRPKKLAEEAVTISQHLKRAIDLLHEGETRYPSIDCRPCSEIYSENQRDYLVEERVDVSDDGGVDIYEEIVEIPRPSPPAYTFYKCYRRPLRYCPDYQPRLPAPLTRPFCATLYPRCYPYY